MRLVPGFEVALIDGTPLKATVVGLDRRTDVAVLKLHSDATLPHLQLGDSDLVEVGDWVIAVGRSIANPSAASPTSKPPPGRYVPPLRC